MPEKITISNKEIFINCINEKYNFIYTIGFDDYKNLYKYGIIEASAKKTKLIKLNSKIGFSEEVNLSKYLDFKTYLNSLLHRLEEAQNLKDLDEAMQTINKDLSELFAAKDLESFLVEKDKVIKETIGISGIHMYRTLYNIYTTTKIKIALILIGYHIEENTIIELIKLELSRRSLLEEISKEDTEVDQHSLKDVVYTALKEQDKKIEILMKEVNIDVDELNRLVKEIKLYFV